MACVHTLLRVGVAANGKGRVKVYRPRAGMQCLIVVARGGDVLMRSPSRQQHQQRHHAR